MWAGAPLRWCDASALPGDMRTSGFLLSLPSPCDSASRRACKYAVSQIFFCSGESMLLFDDMTSPCLDMRSSTHRELLGRKSNSLSCSSRPRISATL